MKDYPKNSEQQFVRILGSLPEGRRIVFSLVHSFGGRGSPRS
jgi:hypothetical protein